MTIIIIKSYINLTLSCQGLHINSWFPSVCLCFSVCPADVQQLLVTKEEVPSEQQEWSSRLDQQDPEPPHIKEEQEELCLIQRPVGAGGEDCGGSESGRKLDPDWDPHPESDTEDSDFPEPESEDSDEDWEDPNRKSTDSSVCSKTFTVKGNQNSQTRTHTREKQLSCSLCGKCFTSKAGLRYHLKTHTGEKPYSCSVCGKKCRQKSALTNHMLTHTREKQCSCSVCGKQFKRKSVLRRHMKTHTGEKPFSCSVCGNKFADKGTLTDHMTREKPFSCSVCGKKFTQKVTLTHHMCVKIFFCPLGLFDAPSTQHFFNERMNLYPHEPLSPFGFMLNCYRKDCLLLF
uniref:C2H2-type domain-containing protein n=1 Tax=Lates calcarifer TaxID=8187 RepID=A0A4W6DSF8_LATCA